MISPVHVRLFGRDREGDGMEARRSLGRQFEWLWAAYAASTCGTWLGFGAFPLIAIVVLHSGATEVSALAAAGGGTRVQVGVVFRCFFPDRDRGAAFRADRGVGAGRGRVGGRGGGVAAT